MAAAKHDRTQRGCLVSQETAKQKAVFGTTPSCAANKYFSYLQLLS